MNMFEDHNPLTTASSTLSENNDRISDAYGLLPNPMMLRERGASLSNIEVGRDLGQGCCRDAIASASFPNVSPENWLLQGQKQSSLSSESNNVEDIQISDTPNGTLRERDSLTGMVAGEILTAQAAVQTAQYLLKNFATSPDFSTKMRVAFGNSFDANIASKLAQAWSAGDFSRFPGIEIRSSSEINGALGAFAAATNKIYLSRELVNQGDVGAVASVFLEEYGHHIDSQINTTDAAGDEGEIFAALVQGKGLSESDVLVLKGEDDGAIVTLDGELAQIEQKVESDTLDFFAKDINIGEVFNFNPDDWKKVLIETPTQNYNGDFPGGNYNVNLGVNIGFFPQLEATKGKISELQYPVNLEVDLPNNVSNGQLANIDFSNYSLGSGTSLNGAGAALKGKLGLKLALGDYKIDLSEIKLPLDLPPIPPASIQGNLNTEINLLDELTYKPPVVGDFVSIKATQPNIKELKLSETQVSNTSTLPDIKSSGRDDFLNLQGDIDKLFGVSPTQKKDLGLFELSFDLYDIKGNLGLGVTQDVKLVAPSQQPGRVYVTMSTTDGQQQSGFLDDPNSKFEFTVPSQGTGVMKVKAKYQLQGKITNEIAFQGLGSLVADVFKGKLAAKVGTPLGKLEAKLGGFGPVISAQIPKDGFPIGEPFSKKTLESIDLSKVGIEDDIKVNLEIEKEYEIPYNMPVTISDVTIKEGDNSPPGAGKAYFKFGGKYYEWETYTVQPGDTLSQIALSRLGSSSPDAYNFIAFQNNIPNPDLIFANTQVIQVPKQVPEPDTKGYAVFDITQSGTPNAPAKIKFNTADGTATAGSDYISTSGNLSVPAGGSAVILVPIVGDSQKEETEEFTVFLTKQDGTPFADGVNEIDATGTIIDDDSKPEPPKDKGQTYNDPRIVTLDKQYHDFQAVGEFTLVESTSGDLKIQVRQQAVGNNPLSNVSDNSAVATVLGGKRISIYKDRGLLIDGNPTNIANNDSIVIGDGRIYREGNTYTVVYATGDQLIAKVQPSRINVSVALTKERQGQIKGLLGNFNGDPKDDLAKRDGTVISQPVPIRQLYGEYADSWRINQGESLFDYKPGEDTNTFTNKDFPRKKVTIRDLNPADIQKAEERIGNLITDPTIREATIIDYILTGFDESIIEDAIALQNPDSVLIIAIPPRAFEDFASTSANTPVKIDVLGNDEGTIGVPLVIANFDQTTTKGGTIKLDDNATPDNKSDDQLIYTPAANFTGIDSFNYTLTDGKETSTSKVTISVPVFNLNNLNGNNGFVINGNNAGNFSGVSTSSIGDFNGDGLDDLIIGAFAADPNNINAAGESYVLYGSKAGFPANITPANLNGNNGFIINGIDANGFSGGAVSSAGDLNGDGLDDIAIGAFGATANGKNNAGKTYIVFGSKTPFPVRFNLSDLNGNNGFVLNGVNEFDYLGLSLGKLGDINGDSLDDLLVNAPGPLNSSAGKNYIIYGRKGGFPASLNASDINGTNGFVINETDGNSGSSVSGVGDINGDGMADLIVGTDGANPDNNTPGKSYVVFGSRTGFSPILNRAELNGKNGFVIEGIEINTSTVVSGAGDINGDGADDLIVGISEANANNNIAAGKTYIIFGSKTQFPAVLNLSQINGNNGFILNGIEPDERSGISVSAVGDINGDGFDDLTIGASGASVGSNNAAGRTYILFGTNKGFAANINYAELNGNNGFFLNGVAADDLSGTSVSGAGDINGDGLDDVIIGSPGSLFNNAPGKSFVVFGNIAFGGIYRPTSTPADLQLIKTSSSTTPYIGDLVTFSLVVSNNGAGISRQIKVSDLLPPGMSLVSVSSEQGTYDSTTGIWDVGNLRDGISRTLNIVAKVDAIAPNTNTAAVTAARETDPDSIPNNNNPNEDDQDSVIFSVAGGGGLRLVFDEPYYLAQHPDVKAAVEKRKFKNGFSHFVRNGEKENRDFRVWVFDESYYLAQNPDVKAAVEKGKFRNGLRHFISFGQFEARQPNALDPISKTLQFDEDYYLQQNPDVKKAVEKRKFRTGFAHFIEWGQIEGRKPSAADKNLLAG